MIFDVNQTEFLSNFQREVWYYGKAVLPLEITLPGIDDPEMRDGCIQIYNFTQEIFEDMYNNPARYGNKSPFIYSVYLFNWMLRDGAVPTENGLCWKIPASQKNFEEYISYLSLFGFSYVDKDDYKIMSNDKYPFFLKYWHKMEQLGPKGSAGRWANIQVCDFRLFSKAKRRTFDDLLHTLSDRDKLYFQKMHDYVISKGGKSANRGYDEHVYKYKNDKVMILGRKPYIIIPYWGQSERFINEAKKQPDRDKLISYIQNEVVLCKGCSNKCSGRIVEIEGVKRVICVCHEEIGKLHISSPEYNDEDIIMLKRLLDIKFDLIDNF